MFSATRSCALTDIGYNTQGYGASWKVSYFMCRKVCHCVPLQRMAVLRGSSIGTLPTASASQSRCVKKQKAGSALVREMYQIILQRRSLS